jgi:hypothetical protein
MTMVRLAFRHDEGEPNRSRRFGLRFEPIPFGETPFPVLTQPRARTNVAMTARSSMLSSPATVTPFASWSTEKAHQSSGPAIGSSAISMKPRTQPRRPL